DESHPVRHSILHAADDGGFGAAGVRQQSSTSAARRHGEDLLGNSIDRRTKDGDLSLMHCCRQVEKPFIDGPDRQGAIQAGLLPARAEYALRYAPALRRQADRATDQTDTDDGESLDLHRRLALKVAGVEGSL